MRYTFALVPTAPEIFIDEAQKQFGTIAQGYVLSGNSLPHITLAHFDSDSIATATNMILQKINKTISAIPHIHFIGFGFTKKAPNLWGASLTVARTPELIAQQKTIVEILQQCNATVLTQTGDLYRPHLTLARIKQPTIENFNEKLLEQTTVELALGPSDNQGQLLSIDQNRLY